MKGTYGHGSSFRRRRIFIPRTFPGPAPRGPARGHTWNSTCLAGPAGALLLHAAVCAVVWMVDPLQAQFGRSNAAEMEWTWLPEVELLTAIPAPPLLAERPPEERTDLPLPESIPPAPPLPPQTPEPERVPESESISPATPALAAMDIAPAPDAPDAWSLVRAEILQQLVYPAAARRRGLEGTVRLRLRLDESGRIVWMKILPPRPARELCQAALAAVKRTGPLPDAGIALQRGLIPREAVLTVRFELQSSPFP